MNKSCIARLPENERDAEIYCAIQNLTALTEIQNGGVPKAARFDSLGIEANTAGFTDLNDSSGYGTDPIKSILILGQFYGPSNAKVTVDIKIKRKYEASFLIIPSGSFLVLDAVTTANDIAIAPVTANVNPLTIYYELRNY